jgi:quinol-cytochrome oxidoreductase complex cytochrome b subunit
MAMAPTERKASMSEILREYSSEAAQIERERRAKKKLNPVEGHPFWPHEVVRDLIIICVFTAIVFYACAAMPYYLETPADARGPPAVILPDWYLLFAYGALKITADVSILGHPVLTPLLDSQYNFALSPSDWGPLNAKLLGLIFNVVPGIPFIIVPLVSFGKSRRPVEHPFAASLGMATIVYILMLSVYAIDTVVNKDFPFFGREYGTWMNHYFTLFRIDLLSWMTNLLPIVTFFIMYIPLKVVQRQHGYEAKLNYNYYKVR